MDFSNESEIIQFINIYNISPILIGFRWLNQTINFERNFYLQHNLDYEKKWKDFNILRNTEIENIFFDSLYINDKYIFVHDDERFSINTDLLPKNIRIIRAERGMTDNIFEYCKVIEEAEEVHCIESSFAFLIDNLGLNKNFIIHRYARRISEFETPIYKNVEKIIN